MHSSVLKRQARAGGKLRQKNRVLPTKEEKDIKALKASFAGALKECLNCPLAGAQLGHKYKHPQFQCGNPSGCAHLAGKVRYALSKFKK